MKLREVLERAAEVGDAKRWKLMEACGQHDLDKLPTTATAGGSPPHYCDKCWTAFGRDGTPMNPPKLDAMGD